ncbi:MAG: PspC domain-containing protein [Treponema sp.]|nr:PspC domain-containing protein [Treponema sp.]
MKNTEKKLKRMSSDKIFFGVCSGIADYIGSDATIVRLIFILFTLFYGSGFIFYLFAALLMPLGEDSPEQKIQSPYRKPAPHTDAEFEAFFL